MIWRMKICGSRFAFIVDRASSWCIDWSSEAWDGQRLQIQLLQGRLSSNEASDDSRFFCFFEESRLWASVVSCGWAEIMKNFVGDKQKRKERRQLGNWLWKRTEWGNKRRWITNNHLKMAGWSGAELLSSFIGQEVLCLVGNVYSSDASLRRNYIITRPVYVSWCISIFLSEKSQWVISFDVHADYFQTVW